MQQSADFGVILSWSPNGLSFILVDPPADNPFHLIHGMKLTYWRGAMDLEVSQFHATLDDSVTIFAKSPTNDGSYIALEVHHETSQPAYEPRNLYKVYDRIYDTLKAYYKAYDVSPSLSHVLSEYHRGHGHATLCLRASMVVDVDRFVSDNDLSSTQVEDCFEWMAESHNHTIVLGAFCETVCNIGKWMCLDLIHGLRVKKMWHANDRAEWDASLMSYVPFDKPEDEFVS
tara:strand:+ start:420 stop:1109 length:690 start_codon:yes stop_codon:yes gene_type:complete